MGPEILAPLILTVVLTLTVGGVLLLRPIAKRLGDIAELMLREKQGGTERELRRMGDLLETVDARMTLLEDQPGLHRAPAGFSGPAKGRRGRSFGR